MEYNGKIINNCYIIREKVHENGIFSVWKAHALFSANQFFISFILKKNSEIDSSSLEKYRQTVKSLFYLNNDNILNVFELDNYENHTYEVSEYLNIMNLEDFIKDSEQLAPEQTLNVIVQIAKGMNSLHKKLISHGDLNAGNIWIKPSYGKSDFAVKIGNIGGNILKGVRSESVKNDIAQIGGIYNLLFTGNTVFNESALSRRLEGSDNREGYTGLAKKFREGSFETAEDVINAVNAVKNNEFSKGRKAAKPVFLKNFSANENLIDSSSVERIKYFESLELERTSRIKQESGGGAVYKLAKPLDKKYSADHFYEKAFDERKKYFDALIDETKAYFGNLNSYKKNKNNNAVLGYFDNISKATEKYSKSIVCAQTEILNDMLSVNSENIQGGRINEIVNGTASNFDRIIKESKSYYRNISEDAKKYFEDIYSDYGGEQDGDYGSGIKEKIKKKVSDALEFFNDMSEKAETERCRIRESLLNALKQKETSVKVIDAGKKRLYEKNKKTKIEQIQKIDILNLYDIVEYKKNMKKSGFISGIIGFIRTILMTLNNALTGKSSLFIIRNKIKFFKFFEILHGLFSLGRGIAVYHDFRDKEASGAGKSILNGIYKKYISGTLSYRKFIDERVKSSADFNIIKKLIASDMNRLGSDINTDNYEKSIDEKNKIGILAGYLAKTAVRKYPILIMLDNFRNIDEKSDILVKEMIKKIRSSGVLLLIADKKFSKDMTFYIES